MEEGRNPFKILAGKPAGKRPFRRRRRKYDGNIRMDIKEIGISMRNWVDSAKDRDYWRVLVNAVLNLRIPLDMELDSNYLIKEIQGVAK